MNIERFLAALKVINVPNDGWVTLHLSNGEHRSGKLNPLTRNGLVSFVDHAGETAFLVSALYAVDVQQIIAVSLVPR